MNPITMQLVADKYIRLALEEDINGEDVTTCSVMPDYKEGEVQLICKEDGIRKHRLISLLKMEIRSQTVS